MLLDASLSSDGRPDCATVGADVAESELNMAHRT